MFYSTTGLVLVALSIGEVLASPTHAHLHRKAHEKKDVDWTALNWEAMGIDWTSAWAAGRTTATAATTTATSTSVPATTTSSVKGDVLIEAVKTKSSSSSVATTTSATATAAASSTSASTTAGLWNGIVGLANEFVEFGEATLSSGSDVSKIGNIGNSQGSNMIKVSSTSSYDFTNEFINTSGETISVFIWNKAYSPTGDAANAKANMGAFVAPKTPTLSFVLAPGASQIVAFQDDTQISWAEATDTIRADGSFGTSWGEANLCSTGSGYDLSAIQNESGNTYNMAISSVESECISDPTQNYWLTEAQYFGSGSCYIAQSTAHLTTKMGGSM